MELTKQQTRLAAIVFLLGIALTTAGADIITPSLPSMSRHFHSTPGIAKLSLNIYLLSYGIFSFPFGILSDSIGRKPILYFGSIVFLITTIAACFSVNIAMLLFCRFIQGLSVAAIAIVSRALVFDFFSGTKYRKMLVYFSLAWSAGMILSPILGGYLQQYFNWQAPYIFLIFYTCMHLILTLCMPEPAFTRQPLNIHQLRKNISSIIKKIRFNALTLLSTIYYAHCVLFAIITPFIMQKVMHYNASTSGKVFCYIGISWLIGVYLTRFLTNCNIEKFNYFAITYLILIHSLSVVYNLLFHISFTTFLIPVLLLALVASGGSTLNYIRSIEPFTHIAGTISAVSITLIYTGTASLTSIAALLQTNSLLPLHLSLLVLLVLGLAVNFVMGYRQECFN